MWANICQLPPVTCLASSVAIDTAAPSAWISLRLEAYYRCQLYQLQILTFTRVLASMISPAHFVLALTRSTAHSHPRAVVYATPKSDLSAQSSILFEAPCVESHVRSYKLAKSLSMVATALSVRQLDSPYRQRAAAPVRMEEKYEEEGVVWKRNCEPSQIPVEPDSPSPSSNVFVDRLKCWT